MPKEVNIEVADSLSGPWRTIKSIQPHAHCDAEQVCAWYNRCTAYQLISA